MNYIKGFVADCQARGLTVHTIQTYRSNVRDFLTYIDDPRGVSMDLLRNYLGELRQRNFQGSTLKGYFASISALYDYLVWEGDIELNPVPSFRKRYLSRLKHQYNGENTRQLPSIQQAQLILAACRHILPLALVMTLAKTGMRRGENHGLKVDDINLRTDTIRIPAKAKRSNRLAFIDDELHVVLVKYLAWRKQRATCDWLWITESGGRIHRDYPGEVLAELGAALGMHTPGGPLCSKLTPHCWRHFFTSHLRRAGMDRRYIKFLRGDCLTSEAWEIYDHIEPEDVRQEYLQCIPRLMPGVHQAGEHGRCSNTNLNPIMPLRT